MESFFAKNLVGNKFESVSGLNCENRLEISPPLSIGEEFTSEKQAIFPAQSIHQPTHFTSYGTFPPSSPPPPSPSTEAANKDGSDSDSYEDPELAESQRKEEKKRKEKYQQMEGEREKVRQDIRDKYGLKKRDSSKLDKAKKKQRSKCSSSSDDKHQLHKSSPSLQRKESPSPLPARTPNHLTNNSQSQIDVFAAKVTSCVVQ